MLAGIFHPKSPPEKENYCLFKKKLCEIKEKLVKKIDIKKRYLGQKKFRFEEKNCVGKKNWV